ncbi:hypothetical protein F5888DRAFT_1582267, partial [Russula emetica]
SLPCIIVDMQGFILAWYLPAILSDFRQVGLFSPSDRSGKPDASQNAMLVAREKLGPLLNKSSGSSWRNNAEYFHPGEGAQGSVNLSPAWFQQGHDETVQQYPQVSANFSSPAALEWLDAISESNAIMSGILAVIHPTLYDAGWKTTKRLRD